MLTCGALRNRIRLERRTLATDAYGDGVETWVEVVTLWASIWTLSADEIMHAGQVQGRRLRRIRIRYWPGLDTSMRIVHGANVCHITSIANIDERSEELEILAEEVPA